MRGGKVDDRLTRALREGCGVLPEDLNQLHAYLMLIAGLLAEKADEHEPDWSLALASAAEIETLMQLETVVARKAARVRATALDQVLTKLAIWQALEPTGEEADEVALRDMLVLSVRLDLERLARDGQTPTA